MPESAVEYEPLLHRLTANEKQQYDQIADLWSEILVAFESGEKNTCQGRNANRYAQFYSAQQRFFLQLMMAYTLPDVIPSIEQDLKLQRSVVLSLCNTGEAQTDRKVRDARANGQELSELDATPREMILQLIEKQFPLFQYYEQTDPVTGNVVRVRVEDAAGNPEINRENERRQHELLDKVADLGFPQNPLDALLTRFGVDNVAEISGRSHRFENGKYVRRKLNGVSRRQLNEYETRLFQQGVKRIAVISGAGSTGISAHADAGARNQQRRVFYAFQLSWSADQQMQAFGRVHRSNQTSAPVIRLVLLDLAGQKRLVNAVSKRLAALGALTKGERHSLSSDLFRSEDVTDDFGKAALGRLYREIITGKQLDALDKRIKDTLDLEVIVLQEINTASDEWSKLRGRLQSSRYQFFEGTTSDRNQFVVLAWDAVEVQMQGNSAQELNVRDAFNFGNGCREDRLRKPVAARFKADAFDFWVVGVHLKSRTGQAACTSQIRTEQCKDLVLAIDNLIAGSNERDVLIVGDHNERLDHPSFEPPREAGFISQMRFLMDQSASGSYIKTGSLHRSDDVIDLIWLRYSDTTEVVRHSACALQLPSAAEAKKYIIEQSDHVPVWVSFGIDEDLDDEDED